MWVEQGLTAAGLGSSRAAGQQQSKREDSDFEDAELADGLEEGGQQEDRRRKRRSAKREGGGGRGVGYEDKACQKAGRKLRHLWLSHVAGGQAAAR